MCKFKCCPHWYHHRISTISNHLNTQTMHGTPLTTNFCANVESNYYWTGSLLYYHCIACKKWHAVTFYSRGMVDFFLNFWLVKSILFFVNWISLYLFHIFLNTTILCLLLLYFVQLMIVMIGHWEFFWLFMPAVRHCTLTSLFLPVSSVPLSYFILDVPMCECLGKHFYFYFLLFFFHFLFYFTNEGIGTGTWVTKI